MRKTFTMNKLQHAALLNAMRPVPAMWIGGPPRSVQQNANDAWMALGRELGFDGMTVLPGRNEFEFSAEEAPITRAPQKSPADLEYESWTARGVTASEAPSDPNYCEHGYKIGRDFCPYCDKHGTDGVGGGAK